MDNLIQKTIRGLEQILEKRKEEVGDMHDLIEDEIIITIQNMIHVLKYYIKERD